MRKLLAILILLAVVAAVAVAPATAQSTEDAISDASAISAERQTGAFHLSWSDLRFLLRATASAMRNHEALDESDYRRAEDLSRHADRLQGVVRNWYEATRPGAPPVGVDVQGLESVIQQAMRPFLTRASASG